MSQSHLSSSFARSPSSSSSHKQNVFLVSFRDQSQSVLEKFWRMRPQKSNSYQTSGTDFSGEKLFATPDYLKMMWRRIELLTQVLEMGFNFIFTMACDRFFGDPYDSDNWVNGGFTYVKSNHRSIEFYKFWYKSRLDYPELHDQDVFNKIKHEA
ncbi:hypothetical protein HID58_094965 [Brassica napus]|uniref:Nucleotide-diphospho-sugar transferase domain-containing protein n=1 Tax=Brassica napus TaxID=3708 RepID=A0ABQ7X7Q9_BRANA|nr:hypothetical protein HID58_094965 [Brassica napus]